MGELMIVAVGASADLVGSRAGREPYERFSARAGKRTDDRRVQKAAAAMKERVGQQSDRRSGDDELLG